jgi:acetyl-CoA carboxylase biotin carboxyl carrier protein
VDRALIVRAGADREASGVANQVVADMSGVVQEVRVVVGDRVRAGQEVVVLESMKMQIPQLSPADGTVAEVRAGQGDFVQEGDVLVVLA